MRIDNLKTDKVDRSALTVVSYKMVRGSLTALLITSSVTFHQRDTLTIKLRGVTGNKMVVDRVPALLLAILTDLKQGMPTTGTPNFIGNADGTNTDQPGGYTNTNAGVRYYMNAIYLPLGHLTLDGAEELEIILEFAKEGPTTGTDGQTVAPPKGDCKFSSVEGRTRVDTLLTYEISDDLETTHHHVRELYAVGVNGQSFFKDNGAGQDGVPVYGVPIPRDITIKLGVDGEDTENDIEAYGAITAITGQLGMQPNSLIRIFQDLEAYPADVYLKCFGQDKDMCEFLIIREETLPHMISASIAAATDKEIKRNEGFEARNPDAARALVQAGVTAPAEKLVEAKAQFVPAVAAPTK